MPIRHGAGNVFGGNPAAVQAVEASNTLQTIATARAVFLVGEGVCGGLANGYQSIYFDDTPLQNPDGSFNFPNVGVEIRLGDPDQQPLTGFPAVENETAVGVNVVAATPIVRTITDAAATAVRVTVGFPALVVTDTATGDSSATSVIFAVDIQPSGQLYATALQQTITDKCTSPQQISFRVPLTGTAPWNIRVRRITPDSTVSTLQNATTWVSYTELQDYRLKYDNSAVIGITINAQTTGGRVPTVSLDWLGCAVEVPSNYDPVARTYSGFWDGTFKLARHANPAWWFWALATHKRFGLGELVEASFTDKWALYAIGQWCDGLVPNGKGGTEPRLSFNAQINTADDAIKALTTLASTFWGQVYWGPGGLMATADKPADPADRKKLVVAANTIDAHIEYTESALKTQHSVVVVTWYDPSNLCKATKETVEDKDRIARWGRRIKEVIKPGCTSQAEAHRFGLWILETEASDEIAAWSASWDQADFLPGELAYIADRTIAGLRYGGRLAGTVTTGPGITGVTLDASVMLNMGESYTISVVMPDGTIADRAVTTGASSTATLSFNEPLPDTPIPGAVWVLTSSALAPRPFRVISRGEDAKNIFPIVAQEHDPTKYDRIERGITLANPPFTALLTGPTGAPTNLSWQESLTLAGGTTARAKMTLSWTGSPDPRVGYYEVQERPLGKDWVAAGIAQGISIDILDLAPGSYGFRVRAVSSLGQPSPWLTLETIALLGLSQPLAPVAGLIFSYISGRASLTWSEINDLRPYRYEIRKGPSVAGAMRVGDVLHPPFGTLGDGVYWVAGYVGPTAGPRIYSSAWVSIEVINSVLVANVVVGHDEQAEGWLGVFAGFAGKSGSGIASTGSNNILGVASVLPVPSILNYGGQASGFYASPYIVNLGKLMPCRSTVTWVATGAPADQNELADPNVIANPDVMGAAMTQYVDVYPVMRIALTVDRDLYRETDLYAAAPSDLYAAGANWGPWQQWTPDVQNAWLVQFGMVLDTNNPAAMAICSAMKWSVDVDDRVDSYGNLSVPNTGLTLTFTRGGSPAPFIGGPNSDTFPHVAPYLANPTAGDTIVVSGVTLAQCVLTVMNGGSAVTRTGVGAIVQGH